MVTFNYDLEKIKEALLSPSHTMPNNLTFENFQKWMNDVSTNLDNIPIELFKNK